MKRKPILDSRPAETVITQGVSLKGNLNIEHDIWIDGVVEGSITCQGSVTIGVNGYVKGKIKAVNLGVGGQVLGDVRLDEKIAIFDTGRLLGDIKTQSIAIADGGIFNGQLNMPDHEPEPGATAHPENEAEHGQPIE